MKYNNAYKKKGLIFKSRPPFEQMPNRSIITNVVDFETCTNEIKTSKYTLLNFLPLNLFYQFSKIANIYFLMIGIMQMIPEISISAGIPVIFMPLSFVVGVSAIKDLFEDLKRKQSDKEINEMTTEVLTDQGFRECSWRELRLGQLVRVKQNEQIPADLIILQTSEQKRNCYIETKNLDGETNLKYKSIAYDLGIFYEKRGTDLFNSRVEFFYERPNPYIHTFSGKTTLSDKTIALDNNNIVLRGCTLRITKYIIGVAIYTGYDTKIMLNSNKTRHKKSRLEFRMGLIVLGIFLTQTILTFGSALLSASWSLSFNGLYDYLSNPKFQFIFTNQIFKKWGSWILLFTNFVPISLIVTLETVKFIQGILITKFSFNTQQPSTIAVQSSCLNEELGQIEHLFSDKTGTLTCNYMSFKYMVVDGVTYGQNQQDDEKQAIPVGITNVDFHDTRFMINLARRGTNQMLEIVEYMLCLCLCHTVIVEQDEQGGLKYNASSPDELAFINFTKYCGFEYMGLNKNNEHVILQGGKELLYKHLHTIEFNSDRKRMSVLLQKDNEIILYTKGADNMIIARLKDRSTKVLEVTEKKLEEFSMMGLRTLLFAKRKISREYYLKWSKLYVNSLTKLEVIENEEKERLKEENQLKRSIRKSQSMNLNLSKVLDIKNTFKKIGETIVEAENQDKMYKQAEKEQFELSDELYLTQHQKKFMKEHKNQGGAIDSQMSATQLQETIEKDLILLGASAIEDKLQDNVKETIQSLRKAGIKVWMLTGDKKETAINIGHSCGLIDEDMAKLIFEENIQKTKQQRKLYDREVCLVITGEQLLSTQGSSPQDMISLIDQCKSIIACRVTPKQKQEMVALLRKSKHTTAAVGDGANDVNMINMAHVGIGIKGVEGAQAAQCSDYAISEFQMLSELMLFHGRECYRKNSRLILFNFYKNMVLVLPQLWFGFYNGFSSASMFDPWISQLYNVLFTSVPIVLYAVFDEQFSPGESVSNPQYYTPGITNQYFNIRESLKWFITPSVQSAVMCFVTFPFFEGQLTKDGYMNFFASTGMVIFAEAVIICNLKILIICFQYSIGLVGSIISSIFLFYLTYGFIQEIFRFSPIAGTLGQQLGNPNYYATIIFVVSWVWILDYAEVSYHRIAKDIQQQKEQKGDIELPMLSRSEEMQ